MSLLLPPPRCSWSFPIVPAQCQHSGQSTVPNNPQNAENDGIKKKAKNNEMSATAIEVPIKEGKLTFLCTENGQEAEEGSELFKIDLLKMKQEKQQGSPEKGGESLNGQERGGGEDAQNNGNQMMDQTEIYRELILRHLIADISGTCTKLGLPTELAAWTVDDCRRWVAEMCVQFQLNVPPSGAFLNLDGQKMLALGVDEFQTRFPDGGDTLHAQLQLWKTAMESCDQYSANGNGSIGLHPHPHHHQQSQQQHCCPSVCYGFSSTSPCNHPQNGASPNGWLTPSPNEFPPPPPSSSTCSSSSSSSQYSAFSQQQQYYAQNGLFPGAPPPPLPHPNAGGGAAPSSYPHPHPPPPPAFLQSATQFGPDHSPKQLQCPSAAASIGHHHHRPSACGGGPLSDCSATESMSSVGQQDDSSSVAEDDFAPSATDISHQFFLAPSHHQPPLLSTANFCQQFQAEQQQQQQHFPSGRIIQHQQPKTGSQQQQRQINHQQQMIAQRLPSHGTGGTIHLWHFIRELLDQPKEYGGCVRWVDRNEGTFKIESSHHLARYWGLRKNRSAMNYDKLSRSLRQYYKKGIIQKPEKKQRLVYKFLPPYNQ